MRVFIRDWVRSGRAILAGAWRSLPVHEFIGFAASGAWGVAQALLTPVDEVLAAERRATCLVCPHFNRDLATCGTPGNVVNEAGNINKIGCWCYLPLAWGWPKKRCYRNVVGEAGGWKR